MALRSVWRLGVIPFPEQLFVKRKPLRSCPFPVNRPMFSFGTAYFALTAAASTR
jgi:hypothetical protein